MAGIDLERFRAMRGEHERALTEIRDGRKRSHWMWYVFPQVAGLGTSPMARQYAITSVDEARAYLDDGPLRADYAAMVDAVHDQVVGNGMRVHDLLGSPDDAKLVSSLTLFSGVGRRMGAECHDLDDLVRGADEILDAAAGQRLPRCEFTTSFLDNRSN